MPGNDAKHDQKDPRKGQRDQSTRRRRDLGPAGHGPNEGEPCQHKPYDAEHRQHRSPSHRPCGPRCAAPGGGARGAGSEPARGWRGDPPGCALNKATQGEGGDEPVHGLPRHTHSGSILDAILDLFGGSGPSQGIEDEGLQRTETVDASALPDRDLGHEALAIPAGRSHAQVGHGDGMHDQCVGTHAAVSVALASMAWRISKAR